MHMLHTHFGPVFFRLGPEGNVTFARDGIELDESLILMLIHDHIRTGGLEREREEERAQTSGVRSTKERWGTEREPSISGPARDRPSSD
jgi:hypothetical protein